MEESYGLEKLTVKSSEIIKVLPGEWRVLGLLGDCNRELGKFVQAEKLFNQALPLCRNIDEKTQVLQRLARLYSLINKFEKAEATYKRIIQLNPNSISALNNLAYLYVDIMNKPQDALPFIQKALQMQPGNINLVDTYAWTLAKLGQFQKARDELNKLINKNIIAADVLYHMGYVFEKMTDPEGARSYYRKALEALGGQKGNPIQATIQTALNRVENALNERE
jgi:tetratricopeptide (TPR) repeat protein